MSALDQLEDDLAEMALEHDLDLIDFRLEQAVARSAATARALAPDLVALALAIDEEFYGDCDSWDRYEVGAEVIDLAAWVNRRESGRSL